MSRIGKQPIIIPDNVETNIDGDIIKIKGPKGELSLVVLENVLIKMDNSQVAVSPRNENSKKDRAAWGLTRALIANMVEGVAKGFEKKLEINGVGFKSQMQGGKLVMSLGFSHPVEMEFPDGVEVSAEKNVITVKGIDKYLVGQVAANIRAKKKPEPYKGKGIRYAGEHIKLKAQKKAIGK